MFSSACHSCPLACTAFLHVLGGGFSFVLILFAIIMYADQGCVHLSYLLGRLKESGFVSYTMQIQIITSPNVLFELIRNNWKPNL